MSQDVLITPQTTRRRYDVTQVAWGVVADVVAVLVFVLVGKASHDDASGSHLATAWPFVVGVAGGWVGIFLARLAPLSYPAAAMVLVKTVVLGTALRAVVGGESVSPSFVAVTTVVLALLFVGWRAAVRTLGPRRAARA